MPKFRLVYLRATDNFGPSSVVTTVGGAMLDVLVYRSRGFVSRRKKYPKPSPHFRSALPASSSVRSDSPYRLDRAGMYVRAFVLMDSPSLGWGDWSLLSSLSWLSVSELYMDLL